MPSYNDVGSGETHFPGSPGGLRAVAYAELAQDIRHVIFNCALCDEEMAGDFAIAFSGGDQAQDFQLAGR